MVLWLSWVEVVISLPCLEVGLQMNHFFRGAWKHNKKWEVLYLGGEWWVTKINQTAVPCRYITDVSVGYVSRTHDHSFTTVRDKKFNLRYCSEQNVLTMFFLHVSVRRDRPSVNVHKMEMLPSIFILWTGRSFWFCFLKEGWRIHTPYSKHAPPCSIPSSLWYVNVKT